MRLPGKSLSCILVFMLACLLLAQSSLTAAHAESSSSPEDSLTLFVASDLHYLSPRLVTQGAAYEKAAAPEDGANLRDINEIIDAFVDELIAEKPDVVLLTGDLTLNGDRASHEDLAEKLARIDPGVTRVYVIPGDRDINNPHASRFEGDQALPMDSVTAEEFAEIYASFGLSLIGEDKDFSLDYAVQSPVGPWILMLDTNLYAENLDMGEPNLSGRVDEKLFPWIKQMGQRAKEAGHPLITVTHQNLYRHNPRWTTGYVLENNSKFFEWIFSLGVKLHFSGHIRIQDIVSYEGVSEVTSQALCLYPHQYGVLRYEKGAMEYTTQTLDMARWAKAKGSADPSLLDYGAYARARLDASLGGMGDQIDTERFTQEQRDHMLTLALELNFRYFCGEDVDATAVKELEAYKLLMQNGGDLASYLQFIVEDDRMDDTHLVIAP